MRALLSSLVGVLVLLFGSALPALAAQEGGQPTVLVSGHVTDPSGAAIVGAQVTVTSDRSGPPRSVVTDYQGVYAVELAAGSYTILVNAAGFIETARQLTIGTAPQSVDFALDIAGFEETVRVGAVLPYKVPSVSSATKTTTPLIDVPQSISIASSALIADQRATSMADVTRYMPGVGFAQGEGNRDTPILRGNSSTGDFFVDGVRDDVQYFRDIYNVDHVEALKGPNAMIFGRGGIGGVINRVTRQADWGQAREASVQFGSWENRRFTADVGRGLNETVAVRATALYENSESYRDGVGVERYGFNPTAAFRLAPNTTLRTGYEYFHDERVADRGVPSLQGKPVEAAPETFFGDPTQSPTHATVNLAFALVEHRFGSNVSLRNRTSYGDYDKFYQNVFPGAVDGNAQTVTITAYNNATTRQNFFNQTDIVASMQTGRLGHTLLLGTEIGRQETANFRQTGFFPSAGPAATSIQAPLDAPTISTPVIFQQSATDADNHGVTTIAAAYVQDQIALSRQIQAVAGLRFDSFKADVLNNRTGVESSSDDGLLSPRLGLIYKPAPMVSLYGSYSLTYQPRAGDQLSSLSLTNQALDPEVFRNYEVGAKWDTTTGLAFTAALYQLERGNVVVPDPNDPTVSLLVDAQRTRGLEIGLNGNVTNAWSVAGGYAYQNGQITQSISASAQAGASLPQLPKHSFSLWNRYEINTELAAAVGIIARGDSFTSTDNTVVLPSWARVDAALYYNLTQALRLQMNVENLFDATYHLNAHSNTNITPGSPRGIRFALTTRF